MSHPYILTNSSFTVTFPTGQKTLLASSPKWKEALYFLKSGMWEGMSDLFDPRASLIKWSQGNFEITQEDEVLWNGERIPACLERRIVDFHNEGLPVKPLLAFWERLQANPSKRSVEQLYTFLEHRNIPIDEEGFFYAYKAVSPNWMDKHSGTVLNSIGRVISMPRRNVDDDPANACSSGYHVGDLTYVASFGSRSCGDHFLICRVDPADVVSVPLDANCKKVRTCKYEVIREYTDPLPENLYESCSQYDDEEEEFWEEELTECPGCSLDWEPAWSYCPYCGYAHKT